MLTQLIRAQLALELAAWLALGTWLHQARGWSVPGIVVLAAAVTLAIRLAIVLTSTTISHVVRSPRSAEERLGPWETARMVARETRAMLHDNFWLLPWEAFVVRPDPVARRDAGVPILLVHGYLSNRGMLRGVLRYLENAGGPQVFTFNFRGLFQPVDALAAQLDAQVERVLGETGADRVALVCHSLGGLVARTWIDRHGAGRIACLVTLASPHNGTALARLGLGANAAQMCRGCDFLEGLRQREGDRGPGCPATSVYSVHDNLVSPQDTSRLPWARNAAIKGWGHVSLLDAPLVHRIVAGALREAGVPVGR